MKIFFSICIGLLLFNACSSGDNDDQEISVKSDRQLQFETLIDSMTTVTLPYIIDEEELTNLKYDNFRRLSPEEVLEFVPDVTDSNGVYLVAAPLQSDSFIALLFLRSYLDTVNFTSSETFLFGTYDMTGKLISDIIFAESVTDEEHYKVAGILHSQDSISTEQYEYNFEQGGWISTDYPSRILQYRIWPSGKIELISEMGLSEPQEHPL